MGSIIYVDVKCAITIVQRPGGEKWKYTVVKLLYYMAIVTYCLKVNCDKLKMCTINPKATNKMTQELHIINQQRR